MSKAEIAEYLNEKPKYIDTLQSIVDFEEDQTEEDSYFIANNEGIDACWEYDDVNVHPTRLHQLNVEGIVEKITDTQSATRYCLSDREAAKEALDEVADFAEEGTRVELHDFPDSHDELDGAFDDVVGYDRVKWLLKRAITTDDITNVVLFGPPGSAKTVFLMCVSKLEGGKFISGKPTSGPGVLDVMFQETPRFMLIDELDDMDNDTQRVLGQYTETGIVDETKSGKTRKMKTNTKTFASANHPENVLGAIKDRFLDLHFDAYDKGEFEDVCRHVLPKNEGCTEEEAEKIAKAVWDIEGEGRVRKAIQAARLSRGDPEKVVSVLDEYQRDRYSVF